MKTKKFCKICKKECINRVHSADYCKDCIYVVRVFWPWKNNLKLMLKRKFPNKIVSFRIIIDKIEDNGGLNEEDKKRKDEEERQGNQMQ